MGEIQIRQIATFFLDIFNDCMIDNNNTTNTNTNTNTNNKLLNLRRTCQQSLLKSLMAVGTKDLLNLSVLQPLTATVPLSCQDAVERMFIILQNRI